MSSQLLLQHCLPTAKLPTMIVMDPPAENHKPIKLLLSTNCFGHGVLPQQKKGNEDSLPMCVYAYACECMSLSMYVHRHVRGWSGMRVASPSWLSEARSALV